MRTSVPDEMDIQIGILEGLEWTPGEIAERLDRSTEAVRLRKTGKKRSFIEQIAAWTIEGVAKRVSARFAAADVQRRVNEKAWRNVELLLDRAEKNEDGSTVLLLDPLALATLREAFDRTQGKPLDRKAVLSQHTEIHQHQALVNDERVEVGLDDLEGILAETKQLNSLRKRALLPPAPENVTEALLVAQSEQQNV